RCVRSLAPADRVQNRLDGYSVDAMSLSRRRALLALPAFATGAVAQTIQPAPKRIGFLYPGSEGGLQTQSQQMRSHLAALGWKPGTVTIDGRYAEGNVDALSGIAR